MSPAGASDTHAKGPRASGAMQELRRTYARRAATCRRQGVAMGMATLGLHVGLIAMAALFSERLLVTSIAAWSLALPFLIFFIGTRLRALANVMHECSHGSFVRSATANRWIGELIGVADLSSFGQYRRIHASHHAYLGDLVKDRDLADRWDFVLSEVDGGFRSYLKIATTPRFIVRSFRPVLFSARDSWPVALARIVFIATLLALCVGGHGRMVALYWLLPYCTTYQMVRIWSDAVDHAGLVTSSDEFLRSRNHLLPTGLNWLLLARNDAYHLVHHLFPRLPIRYLPRLHLDLMREPVYARRQHTLCAASSESSRAAVAEGDGRSSDPGDS